MKSAVLLAYSLFFAACHSAGSAVTNRPLGDRTSSLSEAYRRNSSIPLIGSLGFTDGTLHKRQSGQCIDPGYGKVYIAFLSGAYRCSSVEQYPVQTLPASAAQLGIPAFTMVVARSGKTAAASINATILT